MDQGLLYSSLGERIRAARERKKISQNKLAKQLKMNRTSIVNIEHGRQHPPLHTIWDIAEKLGVEASALIPKRHELTESATPVNLDQTTIDKINEQAAGDPNARRKLQDFILWAKDQAKT
jgi:transcriptional regulator with XRE-family HTH domain